MLRVPYVEVRGLLWPHAGSDVKSLSLRQRSRISLLAPSICTHSLQAHTCALRSAADLEYGGSQSLCRHPAGSLGFLAVQIEACTEG